MNLPGSHQLFPQPRRNVSATSNSTPKLGSRPWRYAITASAALHAVLLIGAALCAVELSTSRGHLDTLEMGLPSAETRDLSPLGSARLVELVPAAGKNKRVENKTAENESDAAPNGPGVADGVSTVAGLDGPSSRVRLSERAEPLGSRWSSDSRSRGGLADIVGAAIGQKGRATDGDASGGAVRGGGSGKASFFGVGSTGRRIVFVVDASNSMNHPYAGEAKTRFGQLKLELAKSILGLTEEQQFFIVFFNEHPIPMPADGMEHAYPQNQQRFLEWVAQVPASGLTDPRPALAIAMNLRPDTVFLLTDGTFPRDVQGDLGEIRQSAFELNTIVIGDPKAEKSLKPLATRNGGRFAFIP
jgi:von Willebrand factor type A domain